MPWDGTYGFSSLSEKTRNSNRWQVSLQRQNFLLSYFKDPGRGLYPRPPAQQTGALPTEPTRRQWKSKYGFVLGLSFILPMERFASRDACHSCFTLQRTEAANASRDNVATEEGDLDIMRKMVFIFCFVNQNNGVFYYRWILDSAVYFLTTTYIWSSSPLSKISNGILHCFLYYLFRLSLKLYNLYPLEILNLCFYSVSL